MKRELDTTKKMIKKLYIAFLIAILVFAVVPATVQAAGWKHNKNGYWWQENDYSYPRNQWKTIYGKQYHFNSSGYMDTGWKKIDGKWYYLGGKDDGAKKTYWQKVYRKYYWLASDGAMRTGWQKVYGKYYWLGGSNDGAMKTGWQKVGGKYYLLGNNGDMKSGWQNVYRKKYYLGGANDGSMKTGWQKIDGYWYYFGGTSDGSLKTDTWISEYGVYVGTDGKWNETKYRYSNGEYLSELSIVNNSKDYNNTNLMFWHNYGMSSSDEDFSFHWESGKNEYVVQGNRSRKQFLLKFTPTQSGMQIQVTCQDGQYYSWTSGTQSETWINANYQKVDEAPSRIQ